MGYWFVPIYCSNTYLLSFSCLGQRSHTSLTGLKSRGLQGSMPFWECWEKFYFLIIQVVGRIQVLFSCGSKISTFLLAVTQGFPPIVEVAHIPRRIAPFSDLRSWLGHIETSCCTSLTVLPLSPLFLAPAGKGSSAVSTHVIELGHYTPSRSPTLIIPAESLLPYKVT